MAKTEKEITKEAMECARFRYQAQLAYAMDCDCYLDDLLDPILWKTVTGVETEEDRAKAIEHFENQASRASRQAEYYYDMYNAYLSKYNRLS